LLVVVVVEDDRAAPFVVVVDDGIVAIRWMVLSLGKLRSFKIV